MTWLDALRDFLIAENLVRAPDNAAAKPLPPVWRHPDTGPVAPGDAADQGRPVATHDDGLVVSLMRAPGMPPDPGAEDRRQEGVDIILRGRRVQAIDDLEAQIRRRLVGDPPDPGGRTDWIMAGLYVIQSKPWRAYQPIDTANGVFTFLTGWLFELRA